MVLWKILAAVFSYFRIKLKKKLLIFFLWDLIIRLLSSSILKTQLNRGTLYKMTFAFLGFWRNIQEIHI